MGTRARQFLLLLGLMLASGLTIGRAQEGGSVTGLVVSSWDGSPLPSVVITVRGTTLAAQTDPNGRYLLGNVPSGEQALRFSKPGYASAVVTEVRVISGQTTTVNGNLRPEFFVMEEFEVTAEEFSEQTEAILIDRREASGLLDAIGSEQFSKLGAGDAGQIVARVTGVSVVGGKYAVVRGLSDRYTRTLLNGLEVPSADPYRTSPQLDLFPSAMIDRVSVSKTFTPDQPGGSGGGTIDIVTKPFPEKAFVKASIGTSYNPQSNLKDNFLAAPGSSMDLIDFPDGPDPLDPVLFNLKQRIDKPPNATSRETVERATQRRVQADAVSGMLKRLGPVDFAALEKESPLNTSLNTSAGKTVQLFGNPLGAFAGLNYSRNFRLLEDYPVADYSGLLTVKKEGVETRSNINTDYGANVNLGYRLSDDAEFGFNFMLAHAVDEEVRHTVYDFLEGREGDTLDKWQLHHTEREILNYQLHGHHDFPFLADSEFDWAASLSNTTQDEPYHRFMNFFLDSVGRPTFGDSALPVPQYPSLYFREIDEDALNTRGDWTLPLPFMREASKFKLGILASATDRDFKEQYFGYSGSSGFDPARPNSYLANPELLNYTATPLGGIRTNFTWQRFVELVVGRPYTATQDITAGYPMLDLGLNSWLRIVGGIRVERTFLEIQTRDAGGSVIDQTDILPAAGLVISPKTNIQFRAGFSQTVARPSFREKAPISNYLPDEDLFADGNPNLQMSAITSFDARLEWFPTQAEILSIGLFHKEIESPIELYRLDFADSVTWINRDKAKVTGFEFEARKSFEFLAAELKGLTLGVNIALIQSETAFTQEEYQSKTNANFQTDRTRPLYSQSPYIINMDLSYEVPSWGTSFTLAANLTGERIILTTAQGPDIFEQSPISLDALITQKIGKHWNARFGVRNILNPEYRQTFGDDFDDPIRRAYNRGVTFAFSVGAEF